MGVRVAEPGRNLDGQVEQGGSNHDHGVKRHGPQAGHACGGHAGLVGQLPVDRHTLQERPVTFFFILAQLQAAWDTAAGDQ